MIIYYVSRYKLRKINLGSKAIVCAVDSQPNTLLEAEKVIGAIELC